MWHTHGGASWRAEAPVARAGGDGLSSREFGDFCRFSCADSLATPSGDLRRWHGADIGSATPVTGSAVQVTVILLWLTVGDVMMRGWLLINDSLWFYNEQAGYFCQWKTVLWRQLVGQIVQPEANCNKLGVFLACVHIRFIY